MSRRNRRSPNRTPPATSDPPPVEPNPPRPNKAFLLASIVLLAAWIAFLLVLALRT